MYLLTLISRHQTTSRFMANIGHGKTRPIYVAIASIVSNYAVYITILLFEKKVCWAIRKELQSFKVSGENCCQKLTLQKRFSSNEFYIGILC